MPFTPVVRLALLATVVALAGGRGLAWAAPCQFDTTGDGVPELVVADTTGDGLCDFPTAKTHLHGTLRIKAGDSIEFRGNTVLEADEIIIESGATLRGRPGSLNTLTIMSLVGDLRSEGTLDLGASNDILFTARAGGLVVLGPTLLVAADRLLFDGRGGDVVVAPATISPGELHALAGNRIELRAKGARGGIRLEEASLGARAIVLDAGANTSVVEEKGIVIRGGSVLTTDPARTGLPAGSDLVIVGTGQLTIGPDAVIDSARNLRIGTRRAGDGACIEGNTLLEAQSPSGSQGRVDLRGVRGQIGVADEVTITGRLDPILAYFGACRVGDCTAAEDSAAEPPADPAPADTSTPTTTTTSTTHPFKDDFVKAHNDARDRVKPVPVKDDKLGGEKLPKLEWDEKLRESAQSYANKCVWEHSTPPRTGTIVRPINDKDVTVTGAAVYGENLAATTKKADAAVIAEAVAGWEIERLCYDIQQNKCVEEDQNSAEVQKCPVKKVPKLTDPDMMEEKHACCDREIVLEKGKEGQPDTKRVEIVCGHYTQVVWRRSTKLGCGVTRCTGDPGKETPPSSCRNKAWTFIVCHYQEPGNLTFNKVKERPYEPKPDS